MSILDFRTCGRAVTAVGLSVVLLLSSSAAAASDSSLLAVKNHIAFQAYASADSLLASHLEKTPDDPEALYLRMMAKQTELLDYESYAASGDAFLRSADSVLAILRKRLHLLRGRDSLLCNLYRANIHGALAVVHAKNEGWMSALHSSLTSLHRLKEIVRRDPEISSAWFGIGMFHYYAGKSMASLPFVDERKSRQGMREIERALDAPFPFFLAAANALCWIHIERGEYFRADSLAGAMLDRLPENTLFMRVRCLAALRRGDYEEAYRAGRRLLERSRSRRPVNWSDLVLAHFVVCAAADAQGRVEEAFLAARDILDAPLPDWCRELSHVRKNLESVEMIHDKYRAR